MVIFLYICAVVELLIGFGLFAWSVYLSNSAVQAILGVLASGFGLVTLALAAILREVRRTN
jgi:hypothetical protein